jgi:BMFP domain-containing protein YqiC
MTEQNESNESGTPGSSSKLRDKMQEFEKTIRSGLQDVEQNVRETMRKVVPEDVAGHLSKSKKEFLLAIRSLVDGELKRMDTPPSDKDTKRD